ncbi:MAG: class I SAM-dependent methyltransferase [Verrucomicrobia bacterium]|nr:class I SAM-dependent methyltransferase [Verrucomicrobiota bacterium]
MNPIYEHNRRAWDERARRGERHTRQVLAKDLKNPLPILDPENWLGGNLAGKRVLCLASGGGLQSALCAAAGAIVTVVDISPEMLTQDRQSAAEHGLKIKIIEASMDDLLALSEAGFDIVIQPVSTCYVPDIAAVYRQVARVLAPGGLYLSQHKQPVNLQADVAPTSSGYVVREPYYRTGPLPAVAAGSLHREADTTEFLHRWEELIGGLCRAGFVVEDLVEPRQAGVVVQPGSFEHRSLFMPPYVKIKARRVGKPSDEPKPAALWTPS